jgi:hypothetical protein
MFDNSNQRPESQGLYDFKMNMMLVVLAWPLILMAKSLTK